MYKKIMFAISFVFMSHCLWAQQPVHLPKAFHTLRVQGTLQVTVVHTQDRNEIIPDPNTKMEHVVIRQHPDGTLHLYNEPSHSFRSAKFRVSLYLYTSHLSKLLISGASMLDVGMQVIDTKKTMLLTSGVSKVAVQANNHIDILDVTASGSSGIQWQGSAESSTGDQWCCTNYHVIRAADAGLDIESSGSSNIQLQGYADKTHIKATGASQITMGSQQHSNTFDIRTQGSAQVHLALHANQIKAIASRRKSYQWRTSGC